MNHGLSGGVLNTGTLVRENGGFFSSLTLCRSSGPSRIRTLLKHCVIDFSLCGGVAEERAFWRHARDSHNLSSRGRFPPQNSCQTGFTGRRPAKWKLLIDRVTTLPNTYVSLTYLPTQWICEKATDSVPKSSVIQLLKVRKHAAAEHI